MHPEANSVDDIITHYEELESSATKESSSTSTDPVPETDVTIPADNEHATGHTDETKGYMCHECVVEAWEGTEYAGSPVYALFEESEQPVVDEESAQVSDRCPSPTSVEKLLQPTVREIVEQTAQPHVEHPVEPPVQKVIEPTAEELFDQLLKPTTEQHLENSVEAQAEFPVEEPAEQSIEQHIEQPAELPPEVHSNNDASASPQPDLKHTPSPLVLDECSNTLVDTSDDPVSPGLNSPGNRSSIYSVPKDSASKDSAPKVPFLTHKSLMDNPFEQRINIKTLESYSQGLRTFWTATAKLLGPDYDYDYDTIMQQVGDDSVDLNTPLGDRAGASWPITPTVNVGKPQRNILGKELLPQLEGLGMAWRWFDNESALEKYINVRINMGESWDFGYCFERRDGSQHCMIMRVTVGVQEQKKVYEEVVDGPKIPEKLAGVGVAQRFWWCRQHPESKDHDSKRKARDKRLNERYAEAKKNLEKYTLKEEAQYRFILEESQKNLSQDLEVREKVEGRYSITTLNTLLKLAEIAEALGQLPEAETLNRELVSRRVKRLGQTSEHTCYARFRLAQLLMKAEKWNEAKDVVAENLLAIADYDNSHTLYCRQHIQAGVIAMKRRRIDSALEVVQYLRLLEKNNPNDFKNREIALLVIVEAYTFQRRYDLVAEWLPKLIALYVNGFGTKEKKLERQYELGLALHRIRRPREAINVFKSSIALAKELGMTTEKDEWLLDIFAILGQILFEEKEWNPARFYLENAAKGYRKLLGRESEKYRKAKHMFGTLEAAMQIKLGLAARFAKHQQRQAAKAAASRPMGRRQRVEQRLRDLMPGGLGKAW